MSSTTPSTHTWPAGGVPSVRIRICSGRIANACARPVRRSARSASTTFALPTKPATKAVRRSGIERAWRVELLDAPRVEHRDAVRHRKRLALVVRDEHERDAEPLLQSLELGLHLLAQLEVERAERLVEQQHLRLVDQRAGERDALPLSSRELRRSALGERFELHELQHLDARGGVVLLPRRRARAARRRRCPRRSCAGTARSPGTRC